LEALELPLPARSFVRGDTGFSAAKTFDLEVWLPGQQLYREISSCSNLRAFRRGGRTFATGRQAGPGQGKPEFVHTLNGTGWPWAAPAGDS